MKTKSIVLASALMLAFAAHSKAVVITFEGQANTIYTAPIVREGFTIGNAVGEEQHFHEIDSTNFGLPSNGTGILLNDRDTRIVVSSGGIFTLTDVSVGSALSNNAAVGLTISGYLNNVLTGTVTVATLGNGYTLVSGATLGNVDQLVFDGIGGLGGFVFDNLQLNGGTTSTPDSGGTMAMLGLALAAMVGVRRKVA